MIHTDEEINFDFDHKTTKSICSYQLYPCISTLTNNDFQKTIKAHPLTDNTHIDFCEKWAVLAMLWWRYHHRVGWPEECFFEHLKNGETAILKQLLLPADRETVSLFKSLIPFKITDQIEEIIFSIAQDQQCVEAIVKLNRTSLFLHDLAVIYCTPVVTYKNIQFLLNKSRERALHILLSWWQLLYQIDLDNLNISDIKDLIDRKLLVLRNFKNNIISLDYFSIDLHQDLANRELDTLLKHISIFLCGSKINSVRVNIPRHEAIYWEYIGSKVDEYFERSELIELFSQEPPKYTNKLTFTFESTLN